MEFSYRIFTQFFTFRFALISSLFIPRYYMPSFAPNRIAFSSVMLIMTVLVSVLSVWRPYINAFAQMFLVGIPAVFLFSIELKRVKNHDKKVYDLGVRSMVIGVSFDSSKFEFSLILRSFFSSQRFSSGSTTEFCAIFIDRWVSPISTLSGTS